MASERTEKKRKAIASDALSKQSKKSKKSTEVKDSIPEPAQAVAPTTTDGIAVSSTKPKQKARKRAADFLSDHEDNAANGAAESVVVEQAAEKLAEKPKKKKSKKESAVEIPTSVDPEDVVANVELPTPNKPSKKDKAKKKAVTAESVDTPAPTVLEAVVASVQPSTTVKPSKKDKAKIKALAAGAVTDKGPPGILPPEKELAATLSETTVEKVDDQIASLKETTTTKGKGRRRRKSNAGPTAPVDQTPITNGTNGLADNDEDEALNTIGHQDNSTTSLQAEANRTTEKELEDEWEATEDEDEDQGGALLAGFDSDGGDDAEDEGFETGKDLPSIPNKASKELDKAGKKGGADVPGTVYIGRIPHGFYENEMREYFSQFGTISKLRLSRNRRTGASKHFAFVEFESDDVAKIVAKTMDNYLMFGHILKCKYAPQESLHPSVWKGANKRYKKVPHVMLEGRALEAPKTAEHWSKKTAKEQKKRESKAEKMKELGYEIDLPKMRQPEEVLEQRKLQNAEQQKLLETSEDVTDAPTGVIEPPNGLPKDELVLQAEKQSAKKDKKAKKQPVEANAPTGAIEPPNGLPKDELALKAEQKPSKKDKKSKQKPDAKPPTVSTAIEPHTEKDQPKAEKHEKKKEKKAKGKAEKAEQIQIDSQLAGEVEDAIAEANTAIQPTASANVEANSNPITNGNHEPAENVATTEGEGEKRRRRKRKSKESGVTDVETSALITNSAAKIDGPAKKEKTKKRKSEDGTELKSILKKTKKA